MGRHHGWNRGPNLTGTNARALLVLQDLDRRRPVLDDGFALDNIRAGPDRGWVRYGDPPTEARAPVPLAPHPSASENDQVGGRREMENPAVVEYAHEADDYAYDQA